MIGSFFYDELETLNMSQKTPKFRIWYNKLVDISQSLPLILQNKEKISIGFEEVKFGIKYVPRDATFHRLRRFNSYANKFYNDCLAKLDGSN